MDPARARLLLGLAVASAVAVALLASIGSLRPFIIGIAIAYVLAGAVDGLSRRMPRTAAVLVVLVAALGGIALFFRLLAPPLARQVALFIAELPVLSADATARLEGAGVWWSSLDLPPQLRSMIEAAAHDAATSGAALVRDQVTNLILGLRGLVSFLFGLLIIPFWSFYLLRDRDRIVGWLQGVAGERRREDVRSLLRIVDVVAGRWLRGQVLLCLAVGLATVAGTFIVGQLVSPSLASFTLVLGAVAGITELFPIIGPIIGSIPALLVGASDDPANLLWVALLYLAIQQVENAILVPKIMGDALALHPAALIVALVIGGALFGIVGAIVAAPALALGRAVYRYSDARLAGFSPAEAFAVAHPPARP